MSNTYPNWNGYDLRLSVTTQQTLQAMQAQAAENAFLNDLLFITLDDRPVRKLLGNLEALRPDPENTLLVQPLTSLTGASLVSLNHPHTALDFKDEQNILTVHETKILQWASKTLDQDGENIFIAMIAARLFMGARPGALHTYRAQVDVDRILPALPNTMTLMAFLGERPEEVPNWEDLLDAFARATDIGDNRIGRLSFLLANVLFSVMEKLPDAYHFAELSKGFLDRTGEIENRLFSILDTIPHCYFQPFMTPPTHFTRPPLGSSGRITTSKGPGPKQVRSRSPRPRWG